MALYIVVIVVMAIATILEKQYGTEIIANHLYGAWWFSALWALLVGVGIAWMVKRRMRRWHLVLLHTSFAFILAGALLTRLTSSDGFIHLRLGETASSFSENGKQGPNDKNQLPFQLRLNRFEITYHDGTNAAADYISHVMVIDKEKQFDAQLSMNRILNYRSYRITQNSYDKDMQGSSISVSHDPIGIAVTYTGYALLFISLLWLLANPKGTFRRLLRHRFVGTGAILLLLFCTSSNVRAAETVPSPVADKFGRLFVNYNDRICPMQTFALDFVKKLHGSRSYDGLTAEQVLLSYIFYTQQWDNEPLIHIKNNELREYLGVDKYASVNAFFSNDGYRLGDLLYEYYQAGNNDALHQAAADMDDRLQLVMQVKQGKPFRLFPVRSIHRTEWLCPTDTLPANMSHDEALFIRNIIPMVYQQLTVHNINEAIQILNKLLSYQQKNGATSLPTPLQIWAERADNAIPFATILFIVNLTIGFVCFFVRKHNALFRILLLFSFLCLTFTLALRWIVSNTIPMSNGYETMLIIAWFVMLIMLLIPSRLPASKSQFPALPVAFGFLLSGLFLLVSHIGQMDPQITHIMPVLNSPLLSIHVSIIMISYALLSLTFICGATTLIAFRNRMLASSLHDLSRLLLYPALVTLSLGIFIGAIWANISWGQYWSWDPKETWALITLMVYAVPVHAETLPAFRRPLFYHL